jgi:hypothetical protein
VIMRPRRLLRGKGVLVKRSFVFFVICLAFMVAMPVAASPPVDLPTLEAVGPAVGIPQGTEQEPMAPGQVNFFDSIAPEILVFIVSIAIAATLVGLMRGAQSSSNRLSKTGFNPRDRLHRLARDQTAAGLT